MIKTFIADGKGTNRRVMVDDQNGLLVTTNPCPPLIPQKNRIFRQYLTTDGTATGTSDMQVVASAVAPITYYVPASTTADRYITAVSFEIADASSALNLFGNIAALTNGCNFEYEKENEVVVIHSTLKTNWNFIRMCLGNPAFGTGTAAFIASNVAGASEGIIPVFNFLSVLPPYGLKLDRGTSQRLILRVNDDTTGVDSFDAIAYGFDRFE
jgi:hypothetical protein